MRYKILLMVILSSTVLWILQAAAEYRLDPLLITSSTVIDRDLEFDQTAFVIKGDNISLDLGGHTVTFNNGNTVEVPNRDFEDWIDGTPKNWTVLSGIPHQEKAIYFGSYDLVFPSGGGTILSTPVTLRGGKTYLAFAFVKSAWKDATVRLSILRSSDGQVLAEWENTGLDRGFASKGSPQSDLRFKPKSDIQVTLRLECIGSPSFQIGMVDIKPAFDYGVVAFHYPEETIVPDIPPDYLPSRLPVHVCIMNGTIAQGAGRGVRCAGIRSAGKNWKMKNITVLLNGINTDGIYVSNFSVNPVVEDCTVYSTSASVFNRMHGTAGIFLSNPSGQVCVEGNLIDNVPQIGIAVFSSPSSDASFVIDRNTIKQHAKVSNGFGIILWGGVQNFSVANNLILPYRGRGILLDGSNVKTTCRNGVIKYNQILNVYEGGNFEYPEEKIGCYGIRVRDGNNGDASSFKNIKIKNNIISVHTDEKGVLHACGMSITSSAAGNSIEVCDNVIEATAEGKQRLASAVIFQDTKLKSGSFLGFYRNVLKSNAEILSFGGSNGMSSEGITVLSNQFTRLDNPIPVAKPFGYGFYTGEERNNTLALNTGVDPHETGTVSFKGTGAKDLIIGKYQLKVFVTHQGAPVPLAAVSLKDKNGLLLLEGKTGTGGEVTFYSPETLYWASEGEPQGTIHCRQFPDGEAFFIEAVLDGYQPASMEVVMDGSRVVMLSL
ncbi:MAG: right-handed parallel beta-helix repeat-containing protein [bacterium]